MKNIRSLLFCVFTLLGVIWAQLQAQSDTSIYNTPKRDSISHVKNINKKEHDPNKAWQYSAIIPGLGQIYNGKYWKVPIIYLAGAGAYYYYSLNAGYYNALVDVYNSLESFGELTLEAEQSLRKYNKNFSPNNIDKELLARVIQNVRKDKDRSIIICFGVYFANIIDALVDGYFFDYDVSDDLTLKVNPSVIFSNYSLSSAPSLTLSLQF